MRVEHAQVVITGAGPSGAVAAGLLRKAGHEVLILERETFPRFSIGESLLPHSMTYLEEAGMLQDVVEAGFQYKNGASFCMNGQITEFDFRDKSSKGWGSTYQVQRAKFDQVLANAAERMGAKIRWRHEVTNVDVSGEPTVTVKSPEGELYQVKTKFILDASGYGRLLPRLLKLERPSSFPVREAIFTHVEDRIGQDPNFDRNKIRITVHPEHMDVWFWLIPFSDGRCSLGVVAEASFLATVPGTLDEKLKALVNQDPTLKALLQKAQWDTPVRNMRGYSSNVSTTSGPGFALLGNAGEFLDPVFSSGVTIAFTSASLAAKALDRQFKGETVDWDVDYSQALRKGVDAFRVFVEAWYSGSFQKLIFYPKPMKDVRGMICSILAGYAWDEKNPYVAEPKRRLRVLEEVCAQA
jgi:flavin-dependent dehydrogenase